MEAPRREAGQKRAAAAGKTRAGERELPPALALATVQGGSCHQPRPLLLCGEAGSCRRPWPWCGESRRRPWPGCGRNKKTGSARCGRDKKLGGARRRGSKKLGSAGPGPGAGEEAAKLRQPVPSGNS